MTKILDLQNLKLGSYGKNVVIHPSVQLFNPGNIHVGNNVRIDCFSILSAGKDGIYIGDHVHLAPSVMIFGGGGKVVLEDFCGLSSRVSIYTATDDYSGGHLTNPTVPDVYRNIRCGDVRLSKHAIVGTGSVLMPSVTLGVGASVGAMTYLTKSLKDFMIASGHPARIVGSRNSQILDLERRFLNEAE